MRSLQVIGAGFVAATWLMVPSDASGQKRQRDVISQAEIDSSAQGSTDLFQVIRRLRPHFLEAPKGNRTTPAGSRVANGRAVAGSSVGGSSGIAPLVVEIDGRRDTGVESLRLVLPATVEEVRYLDPARSQNQFGIAANGGAIVVKLRKTVSPPGAARDPTAE